MKTETTISLEPELLQKLERILGANGHSSLSALIEEALRRFLASEKRETYDLHELELINRNADRLNQEAEDVLTYQMEL
jgi:metal-responsive CopG/Arc/MetJ family transcriptional regulator